MSKTTKTRDAVSILNKHFGDDADRRAELDQIKQDMAVGAMIYQARKTAGLTQTELAQRVGTTQSVISDLEDAEYTNHSLRMLHRVAAALGLAVQVRFVEPQALEQA